jgi:FdhD protein
MMGRERSRMSARNLSERAMTDRVAIAPVKRVGRGSQTDQDLVAVEAPISLSLVQTDGSIRRSLGLLLRTPGHDRDLVLGLLLSEGIIRSAADIEAITTDDEDASLVVQLAAHVDLTAFDADRALASTTSCGLCGRLTLRSVRKIDGDRRAAEQAPIPPSVICALPDALKGGQTVFAETGGLHAAGFFDRHGTLIEIREDVGRHNALDKLVGALLDRHLVPIADGVVVVSGRVAFEIVQKAAMAGALMLVAVGAPSSMAVEAARATGMTLIGFARENRFNVYTWPGRVGDA